MTDTDTEKQHHTIDWHTVKAMRKKIPKDKDKKVRSHKIGGILEDLSGTE